MSLPMWIVYDHPTDFPDHYVAREFRLIDKGGIIPESVRTESFVQSKDLEVVREHMRIFGLSCVKENSEDDSLDMLEMWM